MGAHQLCFALDLVDGARPEPTARAATQGPVAAHLAKAGSRPPDTIWRANPRLQGLVGLTDAIGWFGAHGYTVSVPLVDAQPYDLVVDGPDGLQRVQVKTTTYRTRSGVFAVQLATRGGNRSYHTMKRFDSSTSDLLYVLTDARERYLIPTSAVTAGALLSLGSKVAAYRVAAAK